MTPDSLIWYPWYQGRFWSSYAVAQLTWAEQGVYRALLDAAWKDGGLPNDPAALALKARGPVTEFRKHWRAVKQFWRVCPDGLLRNDTLEAVRVEQNARHAKRVEAGRMGGRKAMLSNAKQSLAIEKKRLEEAFLKTRGDAALGGSLAQVDKTGAPELVGEKPTPDQLAELRAVKDALKASA